MPIQAAGLLERLPASARVVAAVVAHQFDVPTVDPRYSAVLGPYAAACNHCVRAELEYNNDLPYEVLTDRVRPWSFKEFEGRQVSVAGRLASAMRANSHLRAIIAAGYYDAATPYFAAEHAVQHLNLPDELKANISFRSGRRT